MNPKRLKRSGTRDGADFARPQLRFRLQQVNRPQILFCVSGMSRHSHDPFFGTKTHPWKGFRIETQREKGPRPKFQRHLPWTDSNRILRFTPTHDIIGKQREPRLSQGGDRRGLSRAGLARHRKHSPIHDYR